MYCILFDVMLEPDKWGSWSWKLQLIYVTMINSMPRGVTMILRVVDARLCLIIMFWRGFMPSMFILFGLIMFFMKFQLCLLHHHNHVNWILPVDLDHMYGVLPIDVCKKKSVRHVKLNVSCSSILLPDLCYSDWWMFGMI